MDPFVHHLDQPIEPTGQTHAHPRVLDRASVRVPMTLRWATEHARLNRIMPWPSRRAPTECALAPDWTQSFCDFLDWTQSFYDFVSHFLLRWTLSFLLQWTRSFCQSFCYSKLDHFATVNSIILLQCWSIFLFCQSFCYCEVCQFEIVNSVILLLWNQSFFYSELNYFTIMLGYFVILSVILLRWTQSFW
jgi:hypothetical protein